MKILILFLLVGGSVQATEFHTPGKNDKVEFTETESRLVSCVHKTKCLAKSVVQNDKKDIIHEEDETWVSPANRFCKLVGGRPMILADRKNNEEDFCKFRDNSWILASDLYRSKK